MLGPHMDGPILGSFPIHYLTFQVELHFGKKNDAVDIVVIFLDVYVLRNVVSEVCGIFSHVLGNVFHLQTELLNGLLAHHKSLLLRCFFDWW